MIWIMTMEYWQHTEVIALLDKKEVLEYINDWIDNNIQEFSINDLDVFLNLEDSVLFKFYDEKECIGYFKFEAKRIKLPKNKSDFCNLFNKYTKGE